MSRRARYDKSFRGYRVFIGDIGGSVGKYQLERVFDKYGTLRDIWVARNPPGFAYVVYKHCRDAESAVRNLNGRFVCGRQLRVDFARPYPGPAPKINYVPRSASSRSRSRSPSPDHYSSSSSSRRKNRSRSRERYDHKRSRSPERRRSHSRGRRSRSAERRSRSHSPHKQRDRRSRSKDRKSRTPDRRSKSRERKSGSKGKRSASREKRSGSMEKRSRSRERKSRERKHSGGKSPERMDSKNHEQMQESPAKDGENGLTQQKEDTSPRHHRSPGRKSFSPMRPEDY